MAPRVTFPRNSPFLSLIMAIFLISSAFADKIIMKNGKIYQGHIMGEANETILISNPPYDPHPKFVPKKEILTIVRESRQETPTFDSSRYPEVELLLGGGGASSKSLQLDPSASVQLGGGIRILRWLSLGVMVDFTPILGGRLALTDGINSRQYESFLSYGGGFNARVFPLCRVRGFPIEPYFFTGYEWTRLIPKESGDFLKGQRYQGGLGFERRISRSLYADVRFVYTHTSYDKIQFLLREGSLNSDIVTHAYALQLGLSYRFL